MSFGSGAEKAECTATLLPAAFDYRKHRRNEVSAVGALCTEREFAPNLGVSQCVSRRYLWVRHVRHERMSTANPSRFVLWSGFRRH
jgi:hypothetical protein